MSLKKFYFDEFLNGEGWPYGGKGHDWPSSLEVYGKDYNIMQNMVHDRMEDDTPLHATSDYDFLKRLLQDAYNGIAIAGTGELTDHEFQSLIKSEEVLASIQRVAMYPNADASERLEDVVFGKLNRVNHIIVNRIIAACTDEVSALVNPRYFSQAFNLLTEKGVGDGSYEQLAPNVKTREWYEANIYLMQGLKKLFRNELKSDPINANQAKLNIFIWYVSWRKFGPKAKNTNEIPT